MAYLTGKVIQVLLVLRITAGIGPDIGVTVFAGSRSWVLVPVFYCFSRSVKIYTVAFRTEHVLLSPVDIGRDAFIITEVFGADACAMTGDAIILHGWCLAEFVSGNKTTLQFVGTADMTLTAGSVALLAMIFEGFGQRRTFLDITSPGFEC